MTKRSLQSSASGRPVALVAPGLGVIAVTYGLARYGFGLYLPQFRTAFGLTADTAGAIAATSYLAYCVAASAAQRLVGRNRGRWALWLAGGTAVLGSLLVAAAWSVPALAVGVLVAGSGAGAASPALVAAVAATVRPDAEPRAQALVNSGTGAGVIVGGLLVLVAPGAWRPTWAGFAVAAVLVTGWADRNSRWSPVPETRVRAPLRDLGRPLVAAVVAGAGCAAVWTFGRDLLTVDGALPAGTTALLWCLLGAAGLIGGLSGDLVLRVGLRRAWLCSAGIAAAAVLLLAGLPGSPAAVALALAAFGAAFVALSGVLIVWGGYRAPAAAPQAAAVLFIALTVGQAVGALVLGAVGDATSTRTAFLVAAALVLAAVPAAEPAVPRPAAEPCRPRR